MIPPVIDPVESPPGEVRLFESLQRDAPGDWTVLHSLDLPRHVKQVSGEIDFVVLIPKLVVICLEVKSHQSVARTADGLWRLGGSEPENRGPFKQAAEAMFSLRNELTKHSGLERVPFVSVVAFPFCPFNVPASEWDPWQVIDERNLQDVGLTHLLTRAGNKFREKLSTTPSARWFHRDQDYPTTAQAEQITRILRPRFECVQSPKSRMKAAKQEIKKYTEEQFVALDALEANPRVLFEGPAGVGKTVIGIEAARRASLSSRDTFFACYNRLLANWLKNETASISPGFSCGTIHSLMLQIARVDVPKDPDASFFSETLPTLALEALIGGHELLGAFEQLVIDEAQDICTPEYLDVLDLLLAGGLSGGRFIFLGDFANQAIYSDHDGSALLAERANLAHFRLRKNCRNRPAIGSLAAVAASSVPYDSYLRPDDGVDVTLLSHSNDDEQVNHLARCIDMLRSEGYQLGDIAVLSMQSTGTAQSLLPSQYAQLFTAADSERVARIRTATVHAFKGLEAPAVVVTGVTALDSAAKRHLLYTAVTRATDRLAVLVHAEAVTDIRDLVLRGAAK